MMWLVKITRKNSDQVQFGNLPNCSYSEAKKFIEQAKSGDNSIASADQQTPAVDGSGQWIEIVEVEGVVI